MKTTDPSPFKRKICMCGCKNSFIPTRKDMKYLNRQHANYHYNNTKRKKVIKYKADNTDFGYYTDYNPRNTVMALDIITVVLIFLALVFFLL